MKLSIILAAAAASVLATAAFAAQPPAAEAPAAAAPVAGDAAKGEATFGARCRMCHAEGGAAPGPSALAAMTSAHIKEVLTTGAMAPMAAGLTPEDINNVATFLTTPAKPAA